MYRHCILIGAPVETGASQPGCLMGPASFRTAGLVAMLQSLGHTVEDRGDIRPDVQPLPVDALPGTRHPEAMIGWTRALSDAAEDAAAAGFPIFLGGDHSLAAGTVAGVARQAAKVNRPLFVLWLDAHPDLHSPDTTSSGNLHGVPVAYFTGLPGFTPYFPALQAKVLPENICMMGIRSVDPAENARLLDLPIDVHDMRAIDESGVVAPLRAFLARIKAAGGMLHVSLDVDFLDPSIAPAVGTTVPGGATFREAHLIMEMLNDAGCVTSLDLVELNPFLDERGRTAQLMVDLTASLLGRKVLDRPTRRF
ncbi:MAG: arginase [Rhodobacteraceae bacterium]|nr:arginase [Paracoccaceae bacterium]